MSPPQNKLIIHAYRVTASTKINSASELKYDIDACGGEKKITKTDSLRHVFSTDHRAERSEEGQHAGCTSRYPITSPS